MERTDTNIRNKCTLQSRNRDVRLRIVDPIIVKYLLILKCLIILYEATGITFVSGGEPMLPMQSYTCMVFVMKKIQLYFVGLYYSFVEARAKISNMKTPL